MLLKDRHRERDSLVAPGNEALPLLETGEVFVAPSVQAGRAQAFGSGLACCDHVSFEIGGVVILRKADNHLEIHAQLGSPKPQLVEIAGVERIEPDLDATGPKRVAIL